MRSSSIIPSAKPPVKHMPTAPTPFPPFASCASAASARSHVVIGLVRSSAQLAKSRETHPLDHGPHHVADGDGLPGRAEQRRKTDVEAPVDDAAREVDHAGVQPGDLVDHDHGRTGARGVHVVRPAVGGELRLGEPCRTRHVRSSMRASSSPQISDGLTSSSVRARVSGRRGSRTTAATSGAIPHTAMPGPRPPTRVLQLRRQQEPERGARDPAHEQEPVGRPAHLGREQLRVDGAERRRPTHAAATMAIVGATQRSAPSPTKKTTWKSVATSRPITATGRRPRDSASRPATRIPRMPGHTRGDPAEQRDLRVREVVGAGQVAIRELRRRRREHVREERDQTQQDESASVPAVEDLADAPSSPGPLGQRPVAARLVEVAPQAREQDQRRRAHGERDPPAVVAEVGQGEQRDREREPETEGEREQRRARTPRAPSGASSIAATDAMTAVHCKAARVTTCDAVNTSKLGAIAATPFAIAAVARPPRISRRRPTRSASALATSANSTPTRESARAKPSASSVRWNESVTASPFWVSSEPLKLARAPTRADCGEPTGLLGAERDRREEREAPWRAGGGSSAAAARMRRAASRRPDPIARPVIRRTTPPKYGTSNEDVASSSTVEPRAARRDGRAADARSRRHCARTDLPARRRRRDGDPAHASRAAAAASGATSTLTSTRRRTCGMLRVRGGAPERSGNELGGDGGGAQDRARGRRRSRSRTRRARRSS